MKVKVLDVSLTELDQRDLQERRTKYREQSVSTNFTF